MKISKSWSKTDSIACGKSGSVFFFKCRPHAKLSTHQTCVGQNTFTRNDQDQNHITIWYTSLTLAQDFLTTILTGLAPISPMNFIKTQQFQALFAPPQAPRQRPIQSWLATWTLARSFGRHRPLADTAMCNCFGKIWEGETTKTWCHRQNSCLVSDSMQAYLSKCGRGPWKP